MQVFLSDNNGTTALSYRFRGSYNYNQLQITKFNDSDYLAVLLFRQKLYDLKPKLYRLVEAVFGQYYPWWDEINAFLGRECFNESNSGQVDVSNLLKLVKTNRSFLVGGNYILLRQVRSNVDYLYPKRHKYYGHVPELHTTTNQDFQHSLHYIDNLSTELDQVFQDGYG